MLHFLYSPLTIWCAQVHNRQCKCRLGVGRQVRNFLSACRVFQPTKNAFVDTLQSILDDVKWSLLFLVLTMWGFAGAFYILFREDQAEYEVSS